jgi:hypothetical protein
MGKSKAKVKKGAGYRMPVPEKTAKGIRILFSPAPDP